MRAESRHPFSSSAAARNRRFRASESAAPDDCGSATAWRKRAIAVSFRPAKISSMASARSPRARWFASPLRACSRRRRVPRRHDRQKARRFHTSRAGTNRREAPVSRKTRAEGSARRPRDLPALWDASARLTIETVLHRVDGEVSGEGLDGFVRAAEPHVVVPDEGPLMCIAGVLGEQRQPGARSPALACRATPRRPPAPAVVHGR